jgi:hypothetical protein
MEIYLFVTTSIWLWDPSASYALGILSQGIKQLGLKTEH